MGNKKPTGLAVYADNGKQMQGEQLQTEYQGSGMIGR